MNATEHAILAALADGKARTSADLIVATGDKPARVRYWLKSLADAGTLELVDTDFGDRCPCCKRALRRPVALWRLAAPASPPQGSNGAERHAPSPSRVGWLLTAEDFAQIASRPRERDVFSDDLDRLARTRD